MRALISCLAALLVYPATAFAQAGTSAQSAEPFKLGTFMIGAAPSVGLVLRDRYVVDLAAANAALENTRSFPRRPMPADMVAVIADYESGLKGRIYAIVNELVQSKALDGSRPPYVRELTQVRTLAPIPRPRMIMNTAVNFYSHIAENAPADQRATAIAERKANRGVPYLFLKAPSSVIGTGDTIVIPFGRTELDWEIELATVIGRPARYVPAPRAEAHVFGYTVMLDISDRGGRPPGGFGQGSDWLVGKGHETFAPLGPWIVPAEFYGDPTKRLHMQLLIDGKLVQEAKIEDMIHNVWELVEYASSIVTLHPGDVINGGTTSGTSSGAMFAGTRSGFLKPGEVMEAKIEGIGTLRNKAVAEKQPPKGSGAQLPPVSSYRKPGSSQEDQ
jgi:2-keto-4-pentenoate hydratase/2-oxohepta-3-ene-1,7-dioic acid hydratase in catechol pathway